MVMDFFSNILFSVYVTGILGFQMRKLDLLVIRCDEQCGNRAFGLNLEDFRWHFCGFLGFEGEKNQICLEKPVKSSQLAVLSIQNFNFRIKFNWNSPWRHILIANSPRLLLDLKKFQKWQPDGAFYFIWNLTFQRARGLSLWNPSKLPSF